MQTLKEQNKSTRFQNFLLKSQDPETYQSEVEVTLKLILQSINPPTFENLLEALKVDDFFWQKIKDSVRIFEGLESTRIDDFESDQSESQSRFPLEDSLPDFPRLLGPLTPNTPTSIYNLIRPVVQVHSSDEEDFKEFLDSRQLPTEPENERIGPIFNSQVIRKVLVDQQGLPDEHMNELFADLEVGLLLYMKEVIGKLVRISEETKLCDEHSYKHTESDTRQNSIGLVLVNDIIDKFKNAEKRELKIQEFYDNKIKNNREKEENGAKEKQALNLNPQPEKAKNKRFNEVS